MAEADPALDPAGAVEVDTAPDTAVPDDAKRTNRLRPILLFGVPLIIVAIALFFWATGGHSASTDNAYVQQDMVSVSADVSGRIVEVNVAENERVEAGDIMFRIDRQPYEIAVEQAKAALADAQVQVATLQSTYAGTSDDIDAARDRLAQAQENLNRESQLMERGFNTRARLQDAQHAVAQARAELNGAEADRAEARERLSSGSTATGESPAIAAARARLEQAELNLARTVVRAPVAGIVSQADRLKVGQQVTTGLPALTIVADARSWVEANFKETDLDRMRVGQRAHVEVDAYSGVELKGHVASIGAGTGSEFSILPAQNASGNWVKVTQRVPVRIALDERSERPLIAGLSADVRVDLD